MKPSRLLDLWVPPPGYRLASLVATTYQLQVDFIEEDLLPVVLGLRHSPARGREFRIELEQALHGVDVTIYLHPDGYKPGFRRSPRIDLIPVPESRCRKLHAKVALVLFIPEQGNDAAACIVRLITGSANLTASGYRNNIELAVAMDHAPSAPPAVATAVRDAAKWLWSAIPPDTEQAQSQRRAMQAVFDARPGDSDRSSMEFVALPREGGLVRALSAREPGRVKTVTIASPFWPAGDDASDVASGILTACGGVPELVRLIGPCRMVEERPCAEMPPALLRSLMERGAERLEVTYAEPGFGCGGADARQAEDQGEYDGIGEEGTGKLSAWRPLHAKALLIEGAQACVLAMGSFNFTRRGLGLHGQASNTEAGIIWRMPPEASSTLRQVLGFSGPWYRVEGAGDGFVVAPEPMDGDEGQCWPGFILAIHASHRALFIEGHGDSWPETVRVSMRDIRSRLVQQERSFDPWIIPRPAAGGTFRVELELVAGWLEEDDQQALSRYPALPDLEVTLEWEDQRTILPVVFIDKHEFPIVERTTREDERMLLDWFLGLRPADEADADGFGHGFDPVEDRGDDKSPGETSGILSYLIRDFVHALPGIRTHLEQGVSTETGLRAVLLGSRSPLSLAREILTAWRAGPKGRPEKTAVAAIFQLVELRSLLLEARLPELPDGMTEALRSQCLAKIDPIVEEIVGELDTREDPVLSAYLDRPWGKRRA